MTTPPSQLRYLQTFYRRQASFYDATRWAFLYGRDELLDRLPDTPLQILLEAGCGTGRNLRRLARRHPDWTLLGVDVSPHMLARAARATLPFRDRVQLREAPYGPGLAPASGVDAVLFSYSLTMFNPGWEAALDQARADLRPGGLVAVVDFHDSGSALFHRWMARHRVRCDGHLLPALEQRFEPLYRAVRPAWGGSWRYFLFVGRGGG